MGAEPGQLGRAGPGPRRLPRTTRCSGSPRIPAYLSQVVRFDRAAAGRRQRPARRPPAVPHRHRHGLAEPAWAPEMTGLDFSPASLAQARRLAGPGRRPGGRFVAEPTSTDAATDLDPGGGPGPRLHRGRRAGLAARHPRGGPVWSPARPARTGRPAVHCARAIPMLWALDEDPRPAPAARRGVPLLRAGGSPWCGTSPGPTSRPTRPSATT